MVFVGQCLNFIVNFSVNSGIYQTEIHNQFFYLPTLRTLPSTGEEGIDAAQDVFFVSMVRGNSTCGHFF